MGLFDKIFKSGKSKGNKEVRLPKIEGVDKPISPDHMGHAQHETPDRGISHKQDKKDYIFYIDEPKTVDPGKSNVPKPGKSKGNEDVQSDQGNNTPHTEPDKSNNQDKGWHADGYGKIVDKNGNSMPPPPLQVPPPIIIITPPPPPPPPPFQPAKPVHKHAIKNCIRDQRRIRIGDSRRKTDTKITIACAHHGRHWDIMNVQDVFEIVPDKTDNNYQPSSSIRPIYTAEEMNPKYKEEITITWVSNQPDPKPPDFLTYKILNMIGPTEKINGPSTYKKIIEISPYQDFDYIKKSQQKWLVRLNVINQFIDYNIENFPGWVPCNTIRIYNPEWWEFKIGIPDIIWNNNSGNMTTKSGFNPQNSFSNNNYSTGMYSTGMKMTSEKKGVILDPVNSSNDMGNVPTPAGGSGGWQDKNLSENLDLSNTTTNESAAIADAGVLLPSLDQCFSLTCNGKPVKNNVVVLLNNFLALIEFVGELLYGIQGYFPQAGWYVNFQYFLFKGQITHGWGWEERPDHRAQYRVKTNGHLTLISVMLEVGIGVNVIVAKVQVFAQGKGDLTLDLDRDCVLFDGKWTRNSPVTIGTTWSLAIGGRFNVMFFIHIEAKATTSITFKGTIDVSAIFEKDKTADKGIEIIWSGIYVAIHAGVGVFGAFCVKGYGKVRKRITPDYKPATKDENIKNEMKPQWRIYPEKHLGYWKWPKEKLKKQQLSAQDLLYGFEEMLRGNYVGGKSLSVRKVQKEADTNLMSNSKHKVFNTEIVNNWELTKMLQEKTLEWAKQQYPYILCDQPNPLNGFLQKVYQGLKNLEGGELKILKYQDKLDGLLALPEILLDDPPAVSALKDLSLTKEELQEIKKRDQQKAGFSHYIEFADFEKFVDHKLEKILEENFTFLMVIDYDAGLEASDRGYGKWSNEKTPQYI